MNDDVAAFERVIQWYLRKALQPKQSWTAARALLAMAKALRGDMETAQREASK